MALMWLAAHWAAEAVQPPRLTVLAVDHGLRPNSGEEARWVVERAGQLGLAGVVLEWQGDKPVAGVQARAREARYRLLIGWCVDRGADALVTAHTLNDQAETFLMRLARGSGVDGLAAMRAVREDTVAIVRPLLGVPRVQLRGTLMAAGERWIEDPSNSELRYERIRWRKTLQSLESEGLAPAMIALSASRLARARLALEHATSRLEASAVAHHDEGATLRVAALEREPEELVVRLLQRLVMRYGAGGEPPQLSALERLAAWISAGKGGGRTLAGCRVMRCQEAVRISREPPRRQR